MSSALVKLLAAWTVYVGLAFWVGWVAWDLVAYHRGWGKYDRRLR